MTLPDPLSLDGLDQIPDPAATVPRAAVPPATMPTEASPTRAERRRRVLLASALGVAWLGAVVVRLGVRADISAPAVAAPLATWVLTLAMGLLLVLRPGPRGLPPGVRAVQHALWIVPAVYVVVATLAARPAGEPGWAAGSTCLVVAGLMALGPLAAAALIFARAFPSASTWRGAAVGALAGLSGAIGIHAHCPYQSWGHLLMAHGPVIVVGAVLGGLFGRTRGRA
jgi:hypothetical protein